MKILDQDLLDRLCNQAASRERKRINHNFHESESDTVQRMCNALQLGTYVQPHRHLSPAKPEFFLVVQGCAYILLFDDNGEVLERIELDSEGPVRAAEIPCGAWHTIGALRENTVLFEVKPGPYLPTSDKDFASWAPREGVPQVEMAEKWFQTALVGALPPKFGL